MRAWIALVGLLAVVGAAGCGFAEGLPNACRMADLNNDGTTTIEEVKQLAGNIGVPYSDEEAREYIDLWCR